jgi:hypothetical protein
MSYVHVTADEMDKKKAELREKAALARKNGDYGALREFDRFEVRHAKPGTYYRGVKNDPRAIAAAQAKGLVPVTDKDEEGWVLERRTEAGLKVNGDLALMKMPRERHIERRAMIELRREEAESGFMAARKDALNKIARDQLRGQPHTDYVIDESKQGQPQTATRLVQKPTT